MERELQHFDIQPLLSSALPEITEFLVGWHSGENHDSPARLALPEDAAVVERRLRWLLLENPLAPDDTRCGLCIRDHTGKIRGVDLFFPGAFLIGDQRLIGLGSGSFFVEPTARMLGFYLFRKYLSSPGYSFFYSTTCNSNSAPVWANLGGCAVPGSERECILPIRLDALLPALVAEKTSIEGARKLAWILGRCANPLARFRGRPATLTVTPCQDWQKLSDLSRRHRPKDRLTADRSVAFLQWRYGQHSDPFPSGVYLVRDSRGNEGWFALGDMARARRLQIRESVLLDAVWPREQMTFSEIFQSIVQIVSGAADALSFRPRFAMEDVAGGRSIIRFRRTVPSAFVITPKGQPRLAAGCLDFAGADGDTALPLAPRLIDACATVAG